MSMVVFVKEIDKISSGAVYRVWTDLSKTIKDLKEAVNKARDRQCTKMDLLYGGKRLIDEETLRDYKIKAKSVIHVVITT